MDLKKDMDSDSSYKHCRIGDLSRAWHEMWSRWTTQMSHYRQGSRLRGWIQNHMARLAERDLMIRYLAKVKHHGEPTPGRRDRRWDALHHQRGQRERVAEYRPAKASDQTCVESIVEVRPALPHLGPRRPIPAGPERGHKGARRAVSRTFEGRHSSFRHDMR